MLEEVKIDNILFLDIETVPAWPEFTDMPEAFKLAWVKKSEFFRKEGQSASDVFSRAGIYSEFGKIICISCGFVVLKNGEKFFRIKSFAGDDEKVILKAFSEVLNKFSQRSNSRLCAHNGKEFDFPYLARKILVNRLPLPKVLDIAGKKPWEINFLDTMELWKFGDYKNFTSLNLLSLLFDIPSPKDDIDGSMVARVYYKDKNLERIVKYCEKDVFTIAQLLLSYKGEELIPSENIENLDS